jgi:hypothetical protein
MEFVVMGKRIEEEAPKRNETGKATMGGLGSSMAARISRSSKERLVLTCFTIFLFLLFLSLLSLPAPPSAKSFVAREVLKYDERVCDDPPQNEENCRSFG